MEFAVLSGRDIGQIRIGTCVIKVSKESLAGRCGLSRRWEMASTGETGLRKSREKSTPGRGHRVCDDPAEARTRGWEKVGKAGEWRARWA